jgi:hypothetical protein
MLVDLLDLAYGLTEWELKLIDSCAKLSVLGDGQKAKVEEIWNAKM